MDVSTEDSAVEKFSEIAETLKCPKSVDGVKKTLSNLSTIQRWILILDNADDLHGNYDQYIPSGNRGAILITSRDRRCAHLGTAEGHEELDKLEKADSIKLLQKVARLSDASQGTEDEAAALTKHLDYHALAILQAGAYIFNKQCGIVDYLGDLRKNRPGVLGKSSLIHMESRYKTVYATIEASMVFLEPSDAEESEQTRIDAFQLLRVLSTFHYENVPLCVLVDACQGVKKALKTPEPRETHSNVLTAWHVEQAPEFVMRGDDDVGERIDEAVERLKSLALVRVNSSEHAWKSVSMHRLVHSWAGDRQNDQERNDALRMTECIVALSHYALRSWNPYYYQFVPHLKLLVESDEELVESAAQSRCMLQTCVQIAWMYYRMGLSKDTYEFTSRLVQRLGLEYQEPTAEFRGLYRVFGMALNNEGSRPIQALRILQAIANLDEKTLDANDPARLNNLGSLGNAHRMRAQTKNAVVVLRKVVEAQKELGKEHKSLLMAQHDLAAALSDDGQNKEAIMLLENVVEIEQRLFPEDKPERLASQHSLAVAYLKDERVEEATPLLEEVARIEAESRGEEHPSTMRTLADAYKRAGRSEDAMALYERLSNAQTLPTRRRGVTESVVDGMQ